MGNDPTSMHHKFIGLGPGQTVQNYGYQPGGLLYVDEFKRQVNDHLEKAKKSRDSYDDTTSAVILAVSEWISDGRSRQVNEGVHSVETSQKRFNERLDTIFNDFTADKLDNSKLNQAVTYTQILSHSARIFADTTTTLAESGKQLKADIQSGLEMAAIQTAVTVGTGGLGALAGSARLAGMGLGGRLLVQTAKLLSTSGGKMFTASVMGAGTSALIRHTKSTSGEQDFLNAASGGFEGLANIGGAGALGELGKDASLLRRLAFKGAEIARELRTAGKGSVLYSIGGNIRTGEGITLDGLASNTATEYLGDALGALATRRMAPHGFANKLVESIVSNLGDGTTGSWAEATKELREAKGNSYSTFDLMKRMLEKGAWSSFLPASSVVSHATGKIQHKNEIIAAKKEHLQEVRKAIEQSHETPTQQLARQQAEFSGVQLAAVFQPAGNGNGNNGHTAAREAGSSDHDAVKPDTPLIAHSDNQTQPVVARIEKTSKDVENVDSTSGDNSLSSASSQVPANHQRFYYVQQPGEADITQAPLSVVERERLSKLQEYGRRNQTSQQEATELEGLQKRLVVTPLNEGEKTRLAQLQKVVKGGEKIGIETIREMQSLSDREQAATGQVLVFSPSALDLAKKAAGTDGKIMVVDIANKQLKQTGVVIEEGLALLESPALLRGARAVTPTIIQGVSVPTQQQAPVTNVANIANPEDAIKVAKAPEVTKPSETERAAKAPEVIIPVDTVNEVSVANLDRLFKSRDFPAAEVWHSKCCGTKSNQMVMM